MGVCDNRVLGLGWTRTCTEIGPDLRRRRQAELGPAPKPAPAPKPVLAKDLEHEQFVDTMQKLGMVYSSILEHERDLETMRRKHGYSVRTLKKWGQRRSCFEFFEIIYISN